MPAAMVHGGGSGVLLMMMTKLAMQQTIKKHRITKSNATKAPSLITISNSKQQHKITCKKTTMATDTLLHQTNLQLRFSSFK